MVSFNDVVDFAEVDAVVFAKDVRESARDLDDDHFGAFHDGSVPHVRRAKVEEAILVGRAGFENDNVDRIDEPPVVIGSFAQIQR